MDIELGMPGQIMPPTDRAIANALRNEADGFDAVWWPDHLMGWFPDSLWTPDLTPLALTQPNPHVHIDPLMMMAAAGAQMTTARVGVVVTDLIRRNPAVLAQTMLTLDHLTKGRAILGLGSGERLNIEPYGMPFDRPVARLSEGIDVMRLLWAADGPVSFEGKFHRLRDAVLGMSPYGAASPPIWTAAHGPRMLDLTGRKSDGWLPTKMTAAEYRDGLGTIRSSARDAGRDPEAITPGLLAYVGVTHTDGDQETAWMARKLWELRLLRDEQSASDVGAPILVVSQFTLYGDARKGRRPTWQAAAPGPVSEPVYEAVCAELERLGAHVERGVFGADMRVESVNDGPITVLLETP